MNKPLPQMVEDTAFAYGGYAKVTGDILIQGDGVRFADDDGSWLVESVTVGGGQVALMLVDRRVHIASVVADVMHRPFEGMSDDPRLHVRVLDLATPVWMRM